MGGILTATAVVVSAGLRSRMGLGPAVACGIAAAMLSASAVGLVLLALEALRWGPLCAGPPELPWRRLSMRWERG